MSVLTHHIDGDVAAITLDNPPQNRLTPAFTDELVAAVEAITRSSARSVVLRAEGPDSSFGGDFRPWIGADASSLRADFAQTMATVNLLEQLRSQW